MDSWEGLLRYMVGSLWALFAMYVMTRLITTAYFKSKEDHLKRLEEEE